MAKIKSGFLGERAIVIPSAIIDEMKTDELAKLLFITDIGFYPNAANHHRKRNATEAAQYILVYCFEGDGWFEIENTRQKVNSNQLFILPKGKAHSYGTNKSWTVYWIHFDGEKAGFFAENFENSKPVDRNCYKLVQTPQVFSSNVVKKSYELPYSELFTDDASVVEAAGYKVKLVEGNRENIKITTEMDLKIAETFLKLK